MQQISKAINMGGEKLQTGSGLVASSPMVGTRYCRQRVMILMEAKQGTVEWERLDNITCPSDRMIYPICVLLRRE